MATLKLFFQPFNSVLRTLKAPPLGGMTSGPSGPLLCPRVAFRLQELLRAPLLTVMMPNVISRQFALFVS